RGLDEDRLRRHAGLGQGLVDRRHRGERSGVPLGDQPSRPTTRPPERSRPMTYRIAVLPGDGIGQEVTPEAVRVLTAVGKMTGTSFEFEQAIVGGAAIDATGGPLPDATLKLARQAHAILFG